MKIKILIISLAVFSLSCFAGDATTISENVYLKAKQLEESNRPNEALKYLEKESIWNTSKLANQYAGIVVKHYSTNPTYVNKAVAIVRPFAKQNDVRAQFNLAFLYHIQAKNNEADVMLNMACNNQNRTQEIESFCKGSTVLNNGKVQGNDSIKTGQANSSCSLTN